jgi:predicted amidohydrolase
MQPDGNYKHYDKRHLFRMANEHQHYSGGSTPLTVELKGWTIRLIICYDLRFPAWSRQQLKVNNNGKITEAGRYDLLVCIAHWPERRSYPWRSLATARAIENVAYAAVVNRVGKDGNDIPYSGDSGVINYLGEWISTTKPHEEKAETVTISRQQLDEFRKNFPAHMDADELEIKV